MERMEYFPFLFYFLFDFSKNIFLAKRSYSVFI